MKKVILLSILSTTIVGCSSTRVDDHSYHYTHIPAQPPTPPVRIVNNYISNPSPANRTINHYRNETVNNINRSHNTYNYKAPRPHQEDEELLYQQRPSPTSYRGLHIEVDRNNNRNVIPASWDDVPRRPSIPPGNAGIPVFYRY